ncbi:MAG: glycosyltransferase family 9 protein [Sedimentisphaerales bacterium]|nr:glycosyltransferase family 9 protein [Sedimentisphaerales bacterium]
MPTISPHKIPVKRNRILAGIIHYLLKAGFVLFGFLKPDKALKQNDIRTGDIRKILIIRIDGLGDIVMSIPAFKAIRTVFPNAHITLLAASPVKGLVELIPVFNEIIYFDALWMTKGYRKTSKLLETVSRLRKQNFDLVIDLRGDFRNNIFMSLLDVRYRLGYDITGCDFFLTHTIPCGQSHHSVDMSHSLINYLGQSDMSTYDLSLSPAGEDRRFASDFLKQNGIDLEDRDKPVVIINPGAKWQGRKWQTRRFAALADKIIEKFDASVILAGSSGDMELVHQIADSMNNTPIIAAGKMSLGQYLALIKECNLHVGLDSGPSHLAAAVGTKVVALYGPARPEAVGPYGTENIVVTKQENFPCSPCTQTRCKKSGNSCMDAITVEDVFSAVEIQLNKCVTEKNRLIEQLS